MTAQKASETVLVTGGHGFLGAQVVRELSDRRATVIPVSRRDGFDLGRESDTFRAFLLARPSVVVHLAATVGGIGANMKTPGTFFYENMKMGLHVLHATAMVKAKLVIVGTVCSYPKDTPPPFKEGEFWNGYPEPTNAAYGIAKKSLLSMCEAYASQYGLSYTYLLPTNLYGPEDGFDPELSHVIPALIQKFVGARREGVNQVECWGTGQATRSFLHVRDAARAVADAALMPSSPEPINLAGSEEISIEVLASLIASIAGYQGAIYWNRDKPDGQPRRVLDGSRAKEVLGWEAKIPLAEGIKETVEWWLTRNAAAAESACPAP